MIHAYLNIPLSLPGGEEGMNAPPKDVKGKLIPGNVIAYHEAYDGGTCIYLNGGIAMITPWSLEQYEAAVSAYWKELQKLGNRKVQPITLNP